MKHLLSYYYIFLPSLLKKFFISYFLFLYFFTGCSQKQPIKSHSAIILFKTPTMKFYDTGFILKYNDMIELNMLEAGNSVLHLKIYKNKICSSTFKCLTSKEFNKNYLNEKYNDNFLYNLFSKDKIYFKDKTNHIFIKVSY